MNVKEQFSRNMADVLIEDIKSALKQLEASQSAPYQEVGTHHH